MSPELSSAVPSVPWPIWRHTGTADELHSHDVSGQSALHVMTPVAPALVLGSTQVSSSVNTVSAEAAGLHVCQRRSGGGIVFVHPVDSVWVDVFISRDDAHWVDDVGRSSLWLGHAWVDALAACGMVGARVYDGPMQRGNSGAVVCFASSAPGEVFVDAMKVVGISQRRSREGARFQCIAYLRWAPEEWTSHLTDESVAATTSSLPVQAVSVDAETLIQHLHHALANH